MSRKRRQSRPAADHPPPLPASMEFCLDYDDILMQILVFLPAKSLIRFKSVCKKWLSLISSDHFCHQHTLLRPKLRQSIIIEMHEKLFYFNQTTKNEKVIIPYSLSVLDRHMIADDSNGLLLLASKHRKNSYYVCNPTTRRLRKIILTKRVDFPCVAAINLAFDPSKSPYYKVVCVRSTTESNPESNPNPNPNPTSYDYLIEVYDSESHTWKFCLKKCTNSRIFSIGIPWKNYIFYNTEGTHYFCFDIAKNEARTISFNEISYGPHDTFVILEESNGHLYLFVYPKSAHHAPIGGEGVMWEMVGDVMLTKYLGLIRLDNERDRYGESLMIRSNEDGSMCNVIIYEPTHRRIMAYYFLDKSSELLVNLTDLPVSRFDEVQGAFQFGEILALV